jgi:hypothetical protein
MQFYPILLTSHLHRLGLREVLPALTGKSYAGLSTAKGDNASLTFFKMVTGALSSQETVQARKDLEDYCSLDTQGMTWIVEALDKLCFS